MYGSRGIGLAPGDAADGRQRGSHTYQMQKLTAGKCHKAPLRKPSAARQARCRKDAARSDGGQYSKTDRARYPRDQSALAPENFTTFAHFCVSSEMKVPNSADEPVSIMPPSSVSLVFSLGSARPALISLLSLSMTSVGVFFGAPTPYQVLAS